MTYIILSGLIFIILFTYIMDERMEGKREELAIMKRLHAGPSHQAQKRIEAALADPDFNQRVKDKAFEYMAKPSGVQSCTQCGAPLTNNTCIYCGSKYS